MGFLHVVQACLKLLSANDPSASASQSSRITSMSHPPCPARPCLSQDSTKSGVLRRSSPRDQEIPGLKSTTHLCFSQPSGSPHKNSHKSGQPFQLVPGM
ncbi:hypothetical protein AAY473_005771 [Plecturocebus cupreus]